MVRRFDVRISEEKQLHRIHKKRETLIWCQCTGIKHKGMYTDNQEEGQRHRWCCSINIADVSLLRD